MKRAKIVTQIQINNPFSFIKLHLAYIKMNRKFFKSIIDFISIYYFF